MHWILQEDLFLDTEWATLTQTLDRYGIPYSAHKILPMGELTPPPQVSEDQVICLGSYSMRHAVARYGWTPGIYNLLEQNFEVQKEHWGDRMLNHDSVVVPFAKAQLHEPAFVRPVDDSKHFTGRLISPEELADWQRKVVSSEKGGGKSLSADTLIQVCSPKKIHAEYRFWVVDGAIVTRSLYKRGPNVVYSAVVDDRLDAFVQEAISAWQPHRAFVIDVCDTEGGVKIVEINAINSAGFYAGDMAKLIAALESMEAPQLTKAPRFR